MTIVVIDEAAGHLLNCYAFPLVFAFFLFSFPEAPFSTSHKDGKPAANYRS